MRVLGNSTPTTQDRKEVFAANVSRLVDLLHLGQMQDAAKRIGVPYKWLWRMAASGIGRIDDRNLPNLQKLAEYFRLPTTDDFWREGVLYWLLSSAEGKGFVEKFYENLVQLYDSELEKLRKIDRKFIGAARQPLGKPIPLLTGSPLGLGAFVPSDRQAKLDRLLTVGRYVGLKQMDEAVGRVIDEAYEREFGGGCTDDDRDRAKKSATA